MTPGLYPLMNCDARAQAGVVLGRAEGTRTIEPPGARKAGRGGRASCAWGRGRNATAVADGLACQSDRHDRREARLRRRPGGGVAGCGDRKAPRAGAPALTTLMYPPCMGTPRRGWQMTARSDGDARVRLHAAFAAEERRGLMLASAARSAAVFVVIAWLAYANPERGLAYAWVLGTGALLLGTGLAQFWLYARRATPAGAG